MNPLVPDLWFDLLAQAPGLRRPSDKTRYDRTRYHGTPDHASARLRRLCLPAIARHGRRPAAAERRSGPPPWRTRLCRARHRHSNFAIGISQSQPIPSVARIGPPSLPPELWRTGRGRGKNSGPGGPGPRVSVWTTARQSLALQVVGRLCGNTGDGYPPVVTTSRTAGHALRAHAGSRRVW